MPGGRWQAKTDAEISELRKLPPVHPGKQLLLGGSLALAILVLAVLLRRLPGSSSNNWKGAPAPPVTWLPGGL
jgi:hypothetical protein